ncbi:MAG: hypothetical protein KAH01_02965, partial [Caldisericia bacterium]|nr:hypothetical protein [Caldisericia bacterium]
VQYSFLRALPVKSAYFLQGFKYHSIKHILYTNTVFSFSYNKLIISIEIQNSKKNINLYNV